MSDLYQWICLTGNRFLTVYHHGIVKRSGQCFAIHGKCRKGKNHITRQATLREIKFESSGCRRGIGHGTLRNIETRKLLTIGKNGKFGSTSGLGVHRAKVRFAIHVVASPIHHVVAAVEGSTLQIISHLHARRTHQSLLAGSLVDAIEAAVAPLHTIDFATAVDGDGNIKVAGTPHQLATGAIVDSGKFIGISGRIIIAAIRKTGDDVIVRICSVEGLAVVLHLPKLYPLRGIPFLIIRPYVVEHEMVYTIVESSRTIGTQLVIDSHRTGIDIV